VEAKARLTEEAMRNDQILAREKIMTWKQIKEAVEEAGVDENEEITVIQCENGHGDGTFHKMRLGRALKLRENTEDYFIKRATAWGSDA
jgi:hypothetical protein